MQFSSFPSSDHHIFFPQKQAKIIYNFNIKSSSSLPCERRGFLALGLGAEILALRGGGGGVQPALLPRHRPRPLQPHRPLHCAPPTTKKAQNPRSQLPPRI